LISCEDQSSVNTQGAEIVADNPVLEKRIQRIIYLIRGQKVILDRDLAALYEVPTKVLKQAVRRHPDRFPDDFMFVLHRQELANWRSQFVTSKSDHMGLRYPPINSADTILPESSIVAPELSLLPCGECCTLFSVNCPIND
jgi:hypothetical protein